MRATYNATQKTKKKKKDKLLIMITLTFNYRPVALQRPRFCQGKVVDSQKGEKNLIKTLIYEQLSLKDIDHVKNHSLYEIDFHFLYEYPKRFSKQKREEINYRPCKPDIDNLIKFYLDCFNDLLYKDDAQIVKLSAKKAYTKDTSMTKVILKYE